jgi:hypothetical protein
MPGGQLSVPKQVALLMGEAWPPAVLSGRMEEQAGYPQPQSEGCFPSGRE